MTVDSILYGVCPANIKRPTVQFIKRLVETSAQYIPGIIIFLGKCIKKNT